MKNRIYFLSLILAFVFLSVLIISKHEIWRDEGRAWLIAGSAEYLPTLFKALNSVGKYSADPAINQARPSSLHISCFEIIKTERNTKASINERKYILFFIVL